MKHVLLLILVVFCMFCAQGVRAEVKSSSLAEDAETKRKVFVIPVTGDVEPVMAAHIQRAVLTATASEPEPLIVLEIDTFGGQVDAALNIVDTMTGVSSGQTVAFVKNKAISAGALIALSCNHLVMKPNTTLGDCAPISFSGNEVKMLGEKFQSPLRAKFRTLARRNNYPPTLAEAMVSDGMEVYRVTFLQPLPQDVVTEAPDYDKAVYLDADALADLSEEQVQQIQKKTKVVAKGELLTMDDSEALDFGFSLMTAASIDEMLGKMGILNFELIRLEENWAESWGRKIAMISPVLMIIGMASLYIEFKAPGFGLPGLVGLLCIGLVLFNQHIVGLADYLELILVGLGLIMFGFEIFVIPGFGIAGIFGFLLIGAGLILSFQSFVLPDPDMPWQAELLVTNLNRVLGSLFASFLLSMAFLRYGLPRLGRVVNGPYLDDTLVASHADSYEAMAVEVGQEGIAATSLRPAGKMSVGDMNIDVITEGNFIEKGCAVKVIALKGNRVIVEAQSTACNQ